MSLMGGSTRRRGERSLLEKIQQRPASQTSLPIDQLIGHDIKANLVDSAAAAL